MTDERSETSSCFDYFDFNSLLVAADIALEDVAIAFHKPAEPWKRRALCIMAQDDPDAFNAYQSTHPKHPEATVKSRRYLASFVPDGVGGMTFVGLFENRGAHAQSGANIVNDPAFLRVTSVMYGASPKEAKTYALKYAERFRFNLRKTKFLRDLIGRLVVQDPGTRAYMRLAENLTARVVEIKQTARITPPMPTWDDLIVFEKDLRTLPQDWAIRLSQWRGVYLIVDQSDGARYVGSAYGETNLMGRWSTHVAGDLGVTAELSTRDVSHLRFSILERLSPDADASDVIARERKWMHRLDTIENGLNV